MIRIGILGAAKIAPPAIITPANKRSDCKVVCIAARDPERARGFAETHGIPESLGSYEALVAHPGIDLIYNALPPNRHADLTIAALEAGKAVLCEKPFAMNANEARAMTAAAKRTGRPLVEAFHYRFHPMFAEILKELQGGSIGKLCAIKAEFSVPIPFAPEELRHVPSLGGGALMDLGCYPLHWIRMAGGGEPRVVHAEADMSEHGVDVSVKARLELAGGTPAQMRCSMAPGQRIKALLAVQGTDGLLVAQNPLAPHWGHSITVRREGKMRRYTVPGETTYDYQLAHMLNVMAGEAEPLTGGMDAIATMELVDAVYAMAGVSRLF